MKKFLLTIFSIAASLFAQNSSISLNYVPDELIVKYKTSENFARGYEVIKEHKQVFDYLKRTSKGIDFTGYKPVYTRLVERIVNENKTEAELCELNSNSNALPDEYKSGFGFSKILKVKMNGNDTNIVELAQKVLKNSASADINNIQIEFCEPNFIYTTFVQPDDPLYPDQWSHQITNIEQAWEITQGDTSVKIAIIDTGIDTQHPDLIANMSAGGFDFVDIDTNVYKASCIELYSGEDYTEPDNDPSDYNGHGTHCAGIAAASGNNGIGIVGAAPGVKLMALRAGFSAGIPGETGMFQNTDIVNAIYYAADNDADVISMSFGGEFSQLIAEAIKYAHSHDVVMIAAAGNSGNNWKQYPAGLDEVLSVTSINKDKWRSSFSNYGLWTDITAPGEEIISSVPYSGGALSDASGYRVLSGTSMAAPYVSGVAALLLSEKPDLKNTELYQMLKSTATDDYISSEFIGSGIVSPQDALNSELVCVAEITSPINFDDTFSISSDLEISGKASSNHFSRYFFEICDYINPVSNWIQVGTDYETPVDSGFLGMVGIPDEGIYYIRLSVQDTANNLFTDVIGPVTVDNRIKEGFPMSTGSTIGGSSPAVADIDNNGSNELIFTTGGGEIYVVDEYGNNKAGWPVQLTNEEYSAAVTGVAGSSSPAVDDLDGDGLMEIVVRDGQYLYVYNSNGEIKQGWPNRLGSIILGNAQIASPVLSDINDDGSKEVIVTHRCDDAVDGKIFLFSADGSIMDGWPVEVQNSRAYVSTPLVADLDGDQQPEIVVQTFYDDGQDRTGKIYLFDEKGNLLSGWPKELSGSSWNSPIAADINNDGIIEIIASSYLGDDQNPGSQLIYAMDIDGNELEGWPVELDNRIFGYYDITAGMSVADINNDGYKEVVVISSGLSVTLCALDWEGEIAWQLRPLQSFDYPKHSSPVIADLNNDGNLELIFTTYSNVKKRGQIVVVNNDGTANEILSRNITSKFWATPTICDVDNDGMIEVAGLTLNGDLYIWDYDGAFNSSSVPWATYQKDNSRNGVIYIEAIPPVAALLVSPVNGAQNQETSLDLVWNPTGNTLRYSIQLSTDSTFSEVILEDSTITGISYNLDSLENDVTYFWRVRSINNFGGSEWSGIRSFTTLKNTPGKVALVFPANNSVQIPMDLNLEWNKTEYAEGYLMHLSKSSDFIGSELLDTLLTDTTISITNLAEGQQFFWNIQPFNSSGEGEVSDTWKFITALNSPDSLTANVIPDIGIKLEWQDRSGYESGYKIERSSEGVFHIIDSVGQDVTVYRDTSRLATGDYTYRVYAYTEFANSEFIVSINSVYVDIHDDSTIPAEYFVTQNYPNPFNPSTKISYGLPKRSLVSITLYDILGKRIIQPIHEVLEAGKYSLDMDLSFLPSGVYLYTLRTDTFIRTRKMVLLK